MHARVLQQAVLLCGLMSLVSPYSKAYKHDKKLADIAVEALLR